MGPLSRTFSLLPVIFCAICFKNRVLGDCSFPATYMNRCWFRMYLDTTFQHYIYRQFTTNIADIRTDNQTAFNNYYSCSSIALDSTDPNNTLYYLYDNYGIPVCAKSVLTSDASEILLQEISVNNSITNASQCSSFFTASCTTCGPLWMTAVNCCLSQPPPFVSVPCPFPGFYQLTASFNGSSINCSSDDSSSAFIYSSYMYMYVQMSLCVQGGLRNMSFKSNTLLQDQLTCMGSLDGKALNSIQTGSTVALLQDRNALYCARFRNVTGGLELLINVKDKEYAGCSFDTSSTNSVLQLILSPITNTPSITMTTTPLSTPTISTSSTTIPNIFTIPTTITSNSTSTSASTSNNTSNSTSTTTPNTATATTLMTTPFTTISTSLNSNSTETTSNMTATTTNPSSASWVTPGSSLSTSPGTLTASGTSKGPPGNIEGATGSCPTTACAAPATCDAATGNCSCQAVFYTYSTKNSSSSSNSSGCVQDDDAIDDTFLKIVVPIIAVSAAGSLIAILALCFATRPLDAALDGAALAAASGAGGGGVPAVEPVVQPVTQLQENPVFASYGSNGTYANLDTIDRSLVTYGDQQVVAPTVPPGNYVMVGSSIPVKM